MGRLEGVTGVDDDHAWTRHRDCWVKPHALPQGLLSEEQSFEIYRNPIPENGFCFTHILSLVHSVIMTKIGNM